MKKDSRRKKNISAKDNIKPFEAIVEKEESKAPSTTDVGKAILGTEESATSTVATTIVKGNIQTGSITNKTYFREETRKNRRLNKKAEHQAKKEARHKNMIAIFKVFKYSKHYRILLYLTVAFDFLTIIGELFMPVILGYAIDCLIGTGAVNFSLLLKYSLIMAGVILGTSVFNYLGNLTMNLYCYLASKIIRDQLFEKFNKVPLSVIDSHQHGDLLDRMVNDIETMTGGFLESFASLFAGIISLIGTLVFMFVINWKMAIIIAVVTPLSLIITLLIAKRSRVLFKRMAHAQGEISGYMEEYFSGQRIVKAFNHEEESIKNYEKINTEFYIVSEKAQFLSHVIPPFTRFINGLVYGLVGMFGSIWAIRGIISVGQISTFLTYSNSFGRPFEEISNEISEIQEAFASANRVFDILEKEDAPSDAHLPTLDYCDGSVDVRNMCFSYNPKEKLLENFNLSVKCGQKIAIVGPTGCGKTTFINLLMRFYDINAGTIEVSGKDISQITRASLRRQYGMVLQESWLFAGTIFENIAYGKDNATKEEVIEASKLAGCYDFIMQMEKGFSTQIEEGGANVSQGQKQLLCIARIMLVKPPMLILDEATSNIDTHTEMKIQEAFSIIMKGRTSFIVAHRLSTIENADLILVMNKGNVIEQGTHKELLKKGGFYANLYNSQFSH